MLRLCQAADVLLRGCGRAADAHMCQLGVQLESGWCQGRVSAVSSGINVDFSI